MTSEAGSNRTQLYLLCVPVHHASIMEIKDLINGSNYVEVLLPQLFMDRVRENGDWCLPAK
jgi:hypothetical protein